MKSHFCTHNQVPYKYLDNSLKFPLKAIFTTIFSSANERLIVQQQHKGGYRALKLHLKVSPQTIGGCKRVMRFH